MKKVQFAKAFKNIGKKVVGIFLKMKKTIETQTKCWYAKIIQL
ncbi:hypothetical protein [Bacillus cereus]